MTAGTTTNRLWPLQDNYPTSPHHWPGEIRRQHIGTRPPKEVPETLGDVEGLLEKLEHIISV